MSKLSDFKDEKLTQELIDKIVFSKVEDNGASCEYALVFGHAMLINERTTHAVKMYKEKRVKKLLFLGGGYGDSNSSDDHVPESHKMRSLALSLGVNPEDIMVEDKSKNTSENIINALKLLNLKTIDTIMLITSEFHLKRCQAIIKKILPKMKFILVKVKDGIHDRENWFLKDDIWENNGKHGSGRTLVENEAMILINGAFNAELADLEV